MDERRVLAEIEEEFRRDEPVLADRLTNFEWPSPITPRRLGAIAAAIIGLVLLGTAFTGGSGSDDCRAAQPAPSSAAAGTGSGAAQGVDGGTTAADPPGERDGNVNRITPMWQVGRCAQVDQSPLAQPIDDAPFPATSPGS